MPTDSDFEIKVDPDSFETITASRSGSVPSTTSTPGTTTTASTSLYSALPYTTPTPLNGHHLRESIEIARNWHSQSSVSGPRVQKAVLLRRRAPRSEQARVSFATARPTIGMQNHSSEHGSLGIDTRGESETGTLMSALSSPSVVGGTSPALGGGVLHRHMSDASACSTFTFVTSSTGISGSWSSGGYIEEDEENGEEDVRTSRHQSRSQPYESETTRTEQTKMDEDMGTGTPSNESGLGESPEVLLEPKVESPDAGFGLMEGLMEAKVGFDTTDGTSQKRPRGRPRKHPIPTLEEKAKITKGRSKTGCYTCRRRKKKCDEAKPFCKNCEKNTVKCEGYPERTTWKSGRERAEEALVRRTSIPRTNLPAVIHGVETNEDLIFLEHYIYRLSAVLTVEGKEKNAFKDMLLPKAMRHLGLMHSILALSSSNLDPTTAWGQKLLATHPNVTTHSLALRSSHHRSAALAEFNADIERQKSGVTANDDIILHAHYGQMLCLFIQSIAESNRENPGEHRWHLRYYQFKRIPDTETDPYLEFIKEYFQFHIAADSLVSLPDPEGRERHLGALSDDFSLPSTIRPEAVRLLGVQDGLWYYMSKITSIRNRVRENIKQKMEPLVDYTSLYRAAEIDKGIREWTPPWASGDERDRAGLLYKQMMWVYLFRTIYPPRSHTWVPDERITAAVDDGIKLLSTFDPDDQQQTLVLAPTFMLGCAAFEERQREPIRKAIRIVKGYTGLKNADRTLDLLERVWQYMDAKDERSWDWQSVAAEMGLDFLAT